MSKVQSVFVEWSLWMALVLTGVVWGAAVVLGMEAALLADTHPLRRVIEDVLAFDRAILAELAKFLGALLWVWLSIYVRIGRKK